MARQRESKAAPELGLRRTVGRHGRYHRKSIAANQREELGWRHRDFPRDGCSGADGLRGLP